MEAYDESRDDESWWETAIRGVVGGRRVILAGGVAPVWTAVSPLVHRLGATAVLVVAAEGRGVGPSPDDPTVTVEPPDGLTMMEMVRFGIAVLRDPPDHVRDAVEEFDPSGEAVVLGTFLNESPALFGRRFVSHRRPEWVVLEDKTTVDEVWDAAGVRRAASRTVRLDDSEGALEAAGAVDAGRGTVWAVDATDGWHGGGHGTRWAPSAADVPGVLTAFGAHGRSARVMPFLEGIPCSVHGIVCDDGVVVLRPVEMVTLRRGAELFYAGCSTFWDPPGAVRDEMRTAAGRVGRHLRERVGFRGAFTIDGVATADGFMPTELNPRPGAGLGTMGRGLSDGFPLLLVVDLITGGVDVGRSAGDIEAELLAAADAARSGGTWRFGQSLAMALDDERRWYVDGEWTDAEPTEAEPTDGASTGAPSAIVSAGARGVRCVFDPTSWPTGPSVAPAAAEFYRHLDAHHGTTFGTLSPAVDLTDQRPGSSRSTS